MAKFDEVLKDCTKLGTKIPTSEYLVNGKHPIIDQGQSDIAGYCNSEDGLFRNVPAIVFGDHTRIVKYIEKPCFLGADGVKLLCPVSKNANCKYLFYQLSHADIPNTGYNRHFKWVKALDFKIPSTDEQNRVVEVLDNITSLILLRQRQLTKLDELVKARFVEMFGDLECNPMNFPRFHLCDLCNVGSSKRIYQEEQSKTGVPFLKISDLVNLIDNGNFSDTAFISSNRYEELCAQSLVPQANDILITSRGTLGKCYIIRKDDKFYFQDGMISWLSNINKKISSTYIVYLFMQSYIQKQILALQAGSTVAYLSISMLKKLNVILPPLPLQNQFAAFMEEVDKQKQTVQQSLNKLELLKKALMQEYFG